MIFFIQAKSIFILNKIFSFCNGFLPFVSLFTSEFLNSFQIQFIGKTLVPVNFVIFVGNSGGNMTMSYTSWIVRIGSTFSLNKIRFFIANHFAMILSIFLGALFLLLFKLKIFRFFRDYLSVLTWIDYKLLIRVIFVMDDNMLIFFTSWQH